MSNPKKAVSPVDEFIKVFYEMSARYGRSELWYDYIDMHAIALVNTCDLRCRDTREEQYNAIVQKYDEKTVQQFAVLTAITMTALLENPEQDFLGTVYHNLGLSKSRAGQFFTPYNVGQMMARMRKRTTIVIHCYDEDFTLKGDVQVTPGWRKFEKPSSGDKMLPKLNKGDIVNINFQLVGKMTTPPKRYTVEALNNWMVAPMRVAFLLQADNYIEAYLSYLE